MLAWVDEDADANWDSGEPPLEGVELQVNDTLNHYSNVGRRAVTDWNGEAALYVWLPGCPEARFEVVSRPPSGYTTLVSEPVPITGPGYGSEETVRLAYQRTPGFPTPTPYAPRLTCETYELGAWEFEMSQSGEIWAVTWDGAAVYDSAKNAWTPFPIEGSGLGLFEDIEVAATGQVLIRAYNVVAVLSGHEWTTVSLDPDRSFGLAPAIGRSPSGESWFYVPAPPDMLVSLDPQTGQWTYYGPSDRGRDANLNVLLSEYLGVQYAFFDTATTDELREWHPPAGWPVLGWHRFSDTEFRQIDLAGWIQDAVLGPDGVLWISHSFGVSSLDPSTGECSFFDPSEQLGYLPEIGSVSGTPTGEIWIAASEAHPILMQLDPRVEASASSRWRFYDPRDGIPDDTSLQDVFVDQGGSIWLGYGLTGITARCSFR